MSGENQSSEGVLDTILNPNADPLSDTPNPGEGGGEAGGTVRCRRRRAGLRANTQSRCDADEANPGRAQGSHTRQCNQSCQKDVALGP